MKPLKSWYFLVIAAVFLAFVSVAVFSESNYQIDGALVSFKASPALQGGTELAIPPIGTVSARTHPVPVKASLSVDRVSLDGLKKLAASSLTKRELFNKTEKQATAAVKFFIIRILVLATLGGAAAGLLLAYRDWRRVAVASLSGLLMVAVLAAATFYTYDYRAFRQPKYKGMISAAPWLMSDIEDKLNTLDSFRQEVKNLAANLHFFYARAEKMDKDFSTDDTIKVLHVSDIHNNPVAPDLISQVVRDFGADMVVDTGDLTDFGTPIEADLASKVKELPVPYIFVPGNHDSPQVVSELSASPNVKVLSAGAAATVGGISFFGYPDPVSSAKETQETQSPAAARRYAKELAALYDHLKVKPDVTAVHEPVDAERLIGRAKVILSGHTHRAKIDEIKGTILINAGTTGAAGIRTFEAEEGLPYTLKLLYFQKDPVRLTAIDSITIRGIQREFLLERTFFGPQPAPAPKPATVN